MTIIVPGVDIETFNIIRFLFASFLVIPLGHLLSASTISLVRKYRTLNGREATTISRRQYSANVRGLAIAIIATLPIIGQGLLEFGTGSIIDTEKNNCTLKTLHDELPSLDDSIDWFDVLEISQECDLRERSFQTNGYSAYQLVDPQLDPQENETVRLYAKDPITFRKKAFAMGIDNLEKRVKRDESIELEIIKKLNGTRRGQTYDLVHLNNLHNIDDSSITTINLGTVNCTSEPEKCLRPRTVGADKQIMVLGDKDFVLCNVLNYRCMRFFSTKQDGIVLHPAAMRFQQGAFEVITERDFHSLSIPKLELNVGIIGLFILANHRYMDLVLETEYSPVSAYVDLMSMVVSVSLDRSFTEKNKRMEGECIVGEIVRPVLQPRGIGAIGVFVASILMCGIVTVITLGLIKFRGWDWKQVQSLRVGSDSRYVLDLSHEMQRDGGNICDPSKSNLGIVLKLTEEGLYTLGIGDETGDPWDGRSQISGSPASLSKAPSSLCNSCSSFTKFTVDGKLTRSASCSSSSSSSSCNASGSDNV